LLAVGLPVRPNMRIRLLSALASSSALVFKQLGAAPDISRTKCQHRRYLLALLSRSDASWGGQLTEVKPTTINLR
jgi:hypothetical protein